MEPTHTNVVHQFSSSTCRTCGGPAPHWKCPQCKETAETFNPDHWRKCRYNTKMQAMCEACGEAESLCTCKTQ